MDSDSRKILSGKRVLLGVASSISAYRALDLASMLRKAGAEVRAVLTENVRHLVGVAAFDAITHQRTITTLWESSHAGQMDHLETTKWADIFVICPATANTLAVLAHGLAGDALGTLAVAWNKRPLLIAPAMNPEMWRNVATQANIQILEERGHRFIGPVEGPTACDDVGKGRLAPVEDLYDAIVAEMQRGAGRLSGKRVLITGGPTREFADDVRCITNPSTGRMGLALAAEAAREGAEVVLVTGPATLDVPESIGSVRRVVTADEMLAAVMEELPRIDMAIFAAAVSDWKPADRQAGKLKKTGAEEEMSLRLVRTPDIAAEANKRRRDGQVFVGFAAESENLESYAGEKMRKKGFSLVFANPINEEGAGFGAESNHGLLIFADGSKQDVPSATKAEIARRILGESLGYLP